MNTVTEKKENEVKDILDVLAPFIAVADAFENSELKLARPEWSDTDGDQDQIVLLESRNGSGLLVLRDFLRAKELYKDIQASK
jgi:hypothetical protein